jgi:hypothetical protein
LEFVALLFLPGLAFIELFQLGREFSFSERLGLAFGLSMAIDVLVLAFRTSGLSVGSRPLLGIDGWTLGGMLGASLVIFAGAVTLRRKATFYAKPGRDDLLVLGLVAAQALLVFVHFAKYPIFPQFQSVDFTSHVRITADLQTGRAAMFPSGLLYYGVHLLMGSLVSLSGDIVLEATQYAMGIITAVSPLLVFASVSSLTNSKRVGLIAGLLYVSTGFVWFGGVFNSGLYANFYGILSILLLFAIIPGLTNHPRSPGIWIALLLAVGSGYLSHYSYVTIIPALIAFPVACFLLERKANIASVAVVVVVVVPGILGAFFRPDLVGLLIQFVEAQAGGNVTGDTPLSQFLAGWPVLRYVVAEVANDLAAVATLGLSVLGVYFTSRSRNPLLWALAIWLLAMLAVAPFTEAAWRFSYMALITLVIFAAVGFDMLLPRAEDRALRQRSKLRVKQDFRRYRVVLTGIVLLALVVNSWSWAVLADASSNESENNQIQQGVLKAMRWMNATVTPGSRVVSVTSSSYNFYQLLYGKPSGYAPLATPDEVVASAASSNIPTYVVLTSLGTLTLPDPSQNPFMLYPKDNRFHLQYNDTGVLVYKLAV